MIERLMTAGEVAEVLNLSRSKVYRMMRLKDIPTITIGKNVRVSFEDLQNYILKNREHKGEQNEQ